MEFSILIATTAELTETKAITIHYVKNWLW
jgi:hypothetical protein